MTKGEIAFKLKQEDLTDDQLMVIEALGWRAHVCGAKEVEEAVGTVICALQGNWGIDPTDPSTPPLKSQ